LQKVASTDGDPDARLFTGPRGRITTAVLRDATSWDEAVTKLVHEHLRRHALRHTGLTWMADARIPIHHLRKIAGHEPLTTTQRYLHPDRDSVSNAAVLLSKHLAMSTDDPRSRARSAPQRQHGIRKAR
jgi:integrase